MLTKKIGLGERVGVGRKELAQTCGIAEWLVHGVHVLKAPRSAEAFARTFAAIIAGQIDLAPTEAERRGCHRCR